MTNINKVSTIGSDLGEQSRKENQNTTSKIKENLSAEKPKSFSDIYDVKFLANFNKDATAFKLPDAQEASKKLQEVISEMHYSKADELLTNYPSEDVIALTNIIKKK